MTQKNIDALREEMKRLTQNMKRLADRLEQAKDDPQEIDAIAAEVRQAADQAGELAGGGGGEDEGGLNPSANRPR